MYSIVILSDFDGTIVKKDLAEHILKVFVKEDWMKYDKLLVENKISLKECIESQYSLINTPKSDILIEIDKVIDFRPDFNEFVNFCDRYNLEIIIVSAGIDFLIHHALKSHSISDLEVFSVRTEYRNKKLIPYVKENHFSDSLDFKNDLVKYYKKQGKFVIYIGDGSSDFGAVIESDFNFTIIESPLSLFCKEKNLKYSDFTEFSQIIEYIKSKFLN